MKSMKKPKTGGRLKGTPNRATAELREKAQAHTETALTVMVELMNDNTAPPATRLAAASLLLERGHGKPKDEPPSMDIINRFMVGKISALQAVLELEAHGLKAGELLGKYLQNELARLQHVNSLNDDINPFAMPRAMVLPDIGEPLD